MVRAAVRVFLAAVAAAWLSATASAGARAQAQDSVDDPVLVEPAAMSPEAGAEEGDHHEGYYYPKPQTVEHYVAEVYTLPGSDRVRRQSFIIGLTKQLVGGQYAPPYAVFAKGEQSDKLIIVGLQDGQLNTIFRARALLATFTSVARATSFFQQNTQPDEATFLDLLKLLGFRQVTISDGKDFAHQIIID
ncbi:MAG TPA: hypothetical protein PLR41_15915 [Alphaproteobacteria bacterium]|nr:hypothetical protein [Alphaproteobacteria bacterium]